MSGHVVFVSYTGQVSGAEKMMLDVVAEALRTGDRVTVACPPGPLTEALPPQCRHVAIPELGLGGTRGVARVVAVGRLLVRCAVAGRTLSRLVRDDDTDTVVNSIFALPAVRLARPPRGAAWLVHDATTTGAQRAVIRVGARAVRVAVACTQAAAAPVRDSGIPVEVVPYGVRWPVDDLSAALRDPPVVGMLSLLTPWKGHRVVLEALARLPGVVAEFAGGRFPGDADYVAELEERARRTDLAGRVRFLGHVAPDTAMAGWDLLVSASTSPEAGPLAVLEAMAHGLPVVATDHGGPTEFLRDDVGILVPPGDARALADAIGAVLSDDSRHRMSERGRMRIAAEHDRAVTLPALLSALTRSR